MAGVLPLLHGLTSKHQSVMDSNVKKFIAICKEFNAPFLNKLASEIEAGKPFTQAYINAHVHVSTENARMVIENDHLYGWLAPHYLYRTDSTHTIVTNEYIRMSWESRSGNKYYFSTEGELKILLSYDEDGKIVASDFAQSLTEKYIKNSKKHHENY